MLRGPVDGAPDDLVRLDPLETARADDVFIDPQIVTGVVIAVRRDRIGRGKRTPEPS